MQRRIRSFVLRAGRVTPRQQKGLDHWYQNFQMPEISPWDFDKIFPSKSATIIEIGFGMGASLLTMAKENPNNNYIGIEVHQAGVGALAMDLHENNINNVRIVAEDAVEVLQQKIANESIDGFQIFFPDPWPKKKHHKRRLIQADFVRFLTEKLKRGAFIHCATDWQDYAEHMMEVLSQEPMLANKQSNGGFAPRPKERPMTKFERRGERLGHGVWDLIFYKK